MSRGRGPYVDGRTSREWTQGLNLSVGEFVYPVIHYKDGIVKGVLMSHKTQSHLSVRLITNEQVVR